VATTGTRNDAAVLNIVLGERTGLLAAAEPDIAFELFACEQILKPFDLSDDEILDGHVGGGNDGGLDGIYALLEGNAILDDAPEIQNGFDPGKVRRSAALDIHLIQAKRSTGFEETAVQKVTSTVELMLGLDHDEAELRKVFSDAVVERTLRIRAAYSALASRHPRISVTFWYASLGDPTTADQKLNVRAEQLSAMVAEKAFQATASVRLVGARELLELHSRQRSYSLELDFSASATDGLSHVAIVPLATYVTFLTDENGDLRRYIFDWNVRDYEGSVEVNHEIAKSLSDSAAPEFWWLNNGVTVICSKATISGRKFHLDDVQVVNGLQTSVTAFNHFKGSALSAPTDKSILIRIIVTSDLSTRDRVIRATNSQTAVPTASLRATDPIQRNLELYLHGAGWYYDRRKNYYKNLGKPLDRIVTISYVAQAMMAIGFSQPDNSRARPSSIIKDDAEYKRLFDPDTPVDLYLYAIQVQRTADAYLRSSAAAAAAQERTNLRFHLATLVVAQALKQKVFHPSQLRPLVPSIPAEPEMATALSVLRRLVAEYITNTGDDPDKVAKSKDFVRYLFESEFPISSTLGSVGGTPDAASSVAEEARASTGSAERKIATPESNESAVAGDKSSAKTTRKDRRGRVVPSD
jgi:hypothetical protein